LIDTSLRRKLILAAATTLAAVAMVSGGSGPAQAEPGTPGEPGEATQVWVETFEDDLDDGDLVMLPDYVGSNGSYTSDGYWHDETMCNGFVMDSQASEDALGEAGCEWGAQTGAMHDWALQLGAFQDAGDPATNHVLADATEYDGTAGVMAKTSTPIQVEGRHYLLVGFNHYAIGCFLPPKLELIAQYQAAEHLLGKVNPCDQGENTAAAAWKPLRAPGDVSRFQYVLKNTEAGGDGNDYAVDNLQVLDESPQLDQEFSRARELVGEDATLTYTITNVMGPLGLRAKANFGFRNPLPEGLDVDPRSLDTTCGDGVVTESPDGTISLEGGDLETDEEACTVTATVTSDEAGTYDNAAAMVAVRGLLEPGSAQITFVKDEEEDGDGGDDGEDEDFTAPDSGAAAGADGTGAYGWGGGVGALSLATVVGGLLWWRRRATS
jgi:hypothetical protein